jgi:hypothetical protein
MNDVVREAGGTLGVAVLGSVLASAYTTGIKGAVTDLPAEAGTAATDSVGAAHAVAGALIAAAFLPSRVQADGRASAHSRRRGESVGDAAPTSTTTSTGTSARLAAATIASAEGAS